MSRVMIIGGGLSGCVVATELAQNGASTIIVEASGRIGGKARGYGCKATDKCNNCGVCLVGGLWEKVETNPNIDIVLNSTPVDATGKPGDYTVVVKTINGICNTSDRNKAIGEGNIEIGEGNIAIGGISSIVVATGFEEFEAGVIGGHLHIDGMEGVLFGAELEAICRGRGIAALFEETPDSVAFIQCVGSRDKKEGAMYCSRVCCGYSTRAAKVIRHYYPGCAITFFYMEMQAVQRGDYYRQLEGLGIEFIKCRPLKVWGGRPVRIGYEGADGDGILYREFDKVFLSEGIHPAKGADKLAEIFGLGQDANGFLGVIGDAGTKGVFVTGCAKQPLKIEEAYADSIAVAKELLNSKL